MYNTLYDGYIIIVGDSERERSVVLLGPSPLHNVVGGVLFLQPQFHTRTITP
jgi:hypothetical protein